MKKTLIIWVMACSSATACKKDFLDVKPDKALTVPTTLTDFQALLDDNNDMNVVPYLNVVSTDDIFTTDQGYASAPTLIRSSYTWEKDLYKGVTVSDWNKPYLQAFYANVVLDGLPAITQVPSNQNEWNAIRGSALFYRAKAFYHLAQEFAAAYDESTANRMDGIPIRLHADVNEKSKRGTLKESYIQIVSDLKAATLLLPKKVSFGTRPTKGAALALLARTYLVMGNYDDAIVSSSACLEIDKKLIDFNALSPVAAKPFPPMQPDGNSEVLFYSSLIPVSFLYNPSVTSIDSTLYKSYANNDLRKTLFFNVKSNGIILFKGTYTGAFSIFAGLATDEVYLIRAECYARTGNTTAAMNDLNALLATRWKTNTFQPYTATDAGDALAQILQERRKELVYRDLRWTDLRRLNKEPGYAKTIKRNLNGQEVILLPGDNKYTFPIPDDEIANSGINQNPR
jgi:tetratricopeptide (TPR) repeat protein